jgi:CubicO group peptidase (beta-lactamase class C family)
MHPLSPEAIFDWDTLTRALADQAPLWQPGTKHGYHARTYGWLLGEIVRRITAKSLGTYFQDEIAGPLGLDFHIGLRDEHHRRVASITAVPPPPPGEEPNLAKIMQIQPESYTARAFLNPPSYRIPDVANTPEWRRAELPSSNGHGTANSIARFGLGFMMPVPGAEMGPNDRAFGHPGMEGSLGFADPEAGVGFGYVMNLIGSSILINERPTALITALYDCLGYREGHN